MAHSVGHMFYVCLYRENIKQFCLSETTKPRVLILCLLHHLVNLYQVCSNYDPGGQKWPRHGGHMFYLDLYKQKLVFYILLILSV